MKDFLGHDLAIGDFLVCCHDKSRFRVSRITRIDPEDKFFWTRDYWELEPTKRTAPWSFIKIDPPESFRRAYQDAGEISHQRRVLTNGEFGPLQADFVRATDCVLAPWKHTDY